MTAPHLGPGQVVAGKYTIRSLLGFTGEVATYKATSTEGYEVALKLYDPAIGQRADLMGQLDSQRQQVAQLPQDCVVPAFDSGYDVTTSAPFSVTEYLQVPSLAKLVETGPLSTDVVATIMGGISRVLDAAHQIGLFHLSLKPSNVFVGPAPAYAVRITDFTDSVVRSATPTHEAYAHCAPWWAPEQMQPGASLAGAADVFAAALIAFCALTGRSYWMSCQSSPPDLTAWQQEVMGQRVPASQRAQELGQAVNGALDGVIARALSVNYAERPHGVGEIARALANLGGPAAGSAPVAKTLALPEMAGYPAVPSPSGEHAAPAGYQPAQGATGAGHGGAGHAGGHAEAGYPRAGYPAVGHHSGSGAAPPEQSTAAAPGLPPIPVQPTKKKSGMLMPMIIGVSVAILLGGGALAFLFMRGDDTADKDASAKSDQNDDDDKTSGDGKGDSAGSDNGGSGGSDAKTAGSSESADPKTVAVTLRCVPQCDKIKVDGDDFKIEDLEKGPLQLLPGKHTAEASRVGYITRKETFVIELGTPFEREFRLLKPSGRRPQRPCGQFLRPCN